MTSAPRRILFIANDAAFLIGFGLPLATGARDAGWEVHIATPLSRATERFAREGLAYHPIRLARSYGTPWGELATLWQLARLYRRVRPEIAHLVTIKPVIYGGWIARWMRVPAIVCAVTGLGFVFVRRGRLAALAQRLLYGGYASALDHPHHRAVFENPEDRDLFVRRGIVAGAFASVGRGAGVDIGRFRPGPEPASEPLVLLAGRMVWDKGVAIFEQAARLLAERGTNARFVLAGAPDPGNPASIPEAQLAEWAERGYLEWWGLREDMPALLADCHVVCLPTLYREGLPRILLEAAACGRPIVATDQPGCRRVVRHGETGLLVAPGDAAALAAAIGQLIGDAGLRRRLGAAGRKLIESEFTVQQVVTDMLQVYDALHGESHQP